MLPKGALTEETLNLAKSAFASGPQNGPGLKKSGINIAEGLIGVNLEAPSKKLFPVYSPLRNRIPRIAAANGATATQWKAITAINSANIWPGVPENTRNGFNTTLTDSFSATFKTLGHDDYVGMEALARSKNFEDVRATAALNLLYSVMISEEKVILGGNVSNIGPVAGLAAVSSATAGSLVAGSTYKVQVSALVLRGFDKAEKAAAGAGANESDGESTVAETTVLIAGGQSSADISWTALRGAVAYNVFSKIDAAGNAAYVATVTTNRYNLKLNGTILGGADANLTNLTGSALEFDGIIKQIENSNGSLFVSKDNGTLTSDTAGGIVEFDAILLQMWESYKLGPTRILCNAAQARDITKKIGASSALSYRIVLEDGQRNIVGGIYVGAYLNKFASSFADGVPNEIPIHIHPNLPNGTILFIVEQLPYPNNQVPNVWEVETLQEYTQYEWALTQRRYEFGIYSQEVLKGYFPAAQAALVNVAEG